jgi:uridine phosphorylase
VQKGDVDPDLPITPDGTVYHLACKRENLADKFILVGDPGRVPIVAQRFDKGSVEFQGTHREICVMTGKYKGTRVTALSTGMGTDNVEIVMNEIYALKEFDIKKHQWVPEAKREPSKIHLIRVGTCGCPRPDVDVGTIAVTRHAIGMDNTSRFYEPPAVNGEDGVRNLEAAANKTGLGKIGVYATKAHPDITNTIVKTIESFNKGKNSLDQQKFIVGTTASGSGFYGCQGRATGRFKGHLTVPNLVDDLGSITFRWKDHGKVKTEQVVNIEMENSALCYLSNCLGYKAGTMCAIIARRSGSMREFASPELARKTIDNALDLALDALVSVPAS